MVRIPVTILTGFLGAGKTTLLNRLLKENTGRKFAVVVNEYGDAGIDGSILEGAEGGTPSHGASVVEISGGAVCCAAMGDTVKAMTALLSSDKDFERVIIETTGLADPLPLARAFLNRPSLEQAFQLDALAALVDASTFIERLDDTEEARKQVLVADIVIMTKTDLADAERIAEVRAAIVAINPDARIVEAVKGAIAASEILDEVFPELEKRPMAKAQAEASNHAHSDITSVHLRETAPFAMDKVAKFIGEYLVANGDRLLRYKGIFNIANCDKRFVFQGVQFDFELLPDRPWRADEERKSDIVLIGTGITKEEFDDAFRACAASNLI